MMLDSNREMLPSLLTANQVAKLLQVSTRTIWRLRSAGEIPPPVAIGASIRWQSHEIHNWINRGCPKLTCADN